MSNYIFVKQASLIKALAHPARLEIIHLLRSHSLTVSQIMRMLSARQAYVSQHLLILKKAKVVVSHRRGKEMYYEVAGAHIIQACDSLYTHVSAKPLQAAPQPEVIDPICHMKLTPTTASYTTEYDGIRHYFCGKGCLKEFHASH